MDLNYCSNLTDGAVEALAPHCTGLTKVNLCDCSNLAVGVVEALASPTSTSQSQRGAKKKATKIKSHDGPLHVAGCTTVVRLLY